MNERENESESEREHESTSAREGTKTREAAPAQPSSLHRRTLLAGAALFAGLEAWQAIAGDAARTVPGARLSVRGQALADVTACEPAYFRDGSGGDCPPFDECGSNTGVPTSCSTATGGTVHCTGDTCGIDMTCSTVLTCSTATCNGAMTGDCVSLYHCGTQSGNCNRLNDCADKSDNCSRLQSCADLAGGCNRLADCDKHAGPCNTLVNCDGHNGVCSGLVTCPDHHCPGEGCSAEGSRVAPWSEPVAKIFDMSFSRRLSRRT